MARNITGRPGLYVHIPYCDTKCAYCDFYSITRQDSRAGFIPSLIDEIHRYGREPYTAQAFDTIYFGGGTPSLLHPAELEQILEALHQTFPVHTDCEITVEANPGTIGPEKLKAFKALGVNRLSMGVQSFDDMDLKTLGRIHSARQAIQSFDDARRAGFENISLDLIFALPGQTLERWQKNLRRILSLAPEHISAYNLIYEEGTLFHRWREEGKIKPAPGALEQKLYETTIGTLQEAGFVLYEVSNFARGERYYSRHNSKYWDHTPYLGFGPSAHSYWPEQRWSNIRSATGYNRKMAAGESVVRFKEQLDDETRMFETVMLGLRTREGIDLTRFAGRFRSGFDTLFSQQTEELIRGGFARFEKDHFRLTAKGLMICDEIIPHFHHG